jgi:hypothetical protein
VGNERNGRWTTAQPIGQPGPQAPAGAARYATRQAQGVGERLSGRVVAPAWRAGQICGMAIPTDPGTEPQQRAPEVRLAAQRRDAELLEQALRPLEAKHRLRP